ncbi:hypothetical protein ACFX10_030598 [Malus domestica]|nr:MYB39 [Malus sieversii]
MGKNPCCETNGLKKGPWSPEEDHKLVHYIQKHGHGRWRTLPKNAGLKRCGKSCRLRWANYLRPDIKRGRFSMEEEETIIQLHSVLGNKWSTIASRLPGRTDNEIKNYWNTQIRKRLLKMGIDPVTHTPRLDLLELTSLLSSTLYNSSSDNLQLNIPNLLSIGPIMDPELLNLAATLLTSQRRPQSSHPEFPSKNHAQQNPLALLQNNDQNQFQSNQLPNVAPFLNQPLITNFGHPCTTNGADQSSFVPIITNQVGSYDSNYESIISHNIPGQDYQPACISDNVNNQSFQNMCSFGSLLSTPSSSPATTTYANCCTEDERDSFCSNILNMYHDIPNDLNVTQLL